MDLDRRRLLRRMGLGGEPALLVDSSVMTESKRDRVGGRVSSHAELDAADEAFRDKAGPAARFEASIELSFTA